MTGRGARDTDWTRGLVVAGAVVLLELAGSCSPPGFTNYDGPTPLWESTGPCDGDGGVGVASTLADASGDGRLDVLLVPTWRDRDAEAKVLAEIRDASSGALVRQFLSATPTRVAPCIASFVGDLDADGREDVAIASGVAGSAHDFTAVLWVYSSDGTRLFDVFAPPGFGFGPAITAAGDVDLDGIGDLALAARRLVPSAAAPSGKLLWISGRNGGALGEWNDEDLDIDALSLADDVDGDGRPDVAVRARRGDGRHTLSVVSSASGQRVWTFVAEPGESWEWVPLAHTSDQDADGVEDVLIPTSRGARVLSARSGAALTELAIGDDRPIFGEVGDWDGDGLPELLARSDAHRSVGWDENIYASFQVISRPTRRVLAEVGYGIPWLVGRVTEDIDFDGLDDFLIASGRNVRAFSRRCFFPD